MPEDPLLVRSFALFFVAVSLSACNSYKQEWLQSQQQLQQAETRAKTLEREVATRDQAIQERDRALAERDRIIRNECVLKPKQ